MAIELWSVLLNMIILFRMRVDASCGQCERVDIAYHDEFFIAREPEKRSTLRMEAFQVAVDIHRLDVSDESVCCGLILHPSLDLLTSSMDCSGALPC